MSDLKTLTKQIQRLVGTAADGIYGRNTAYKILKALDSEEVKPKAKKGKVQMWFSNLFKKKSTTLKFNEVVKLTPNKSTSKINPLGVILHHSGGSYNGGVSWILNKDSNVSYHTLINVDGSRTVFCDDNERAWHAGSSSFKGRKGCNGFMLGVAFTGNTNSRELTTAEVDSAVEYIVQRLDKYGWPKDLSTITTHRDVSPGRKDDVDIRAEKKVLEALAKAIK